MQFDDLYKLVLENSLDDSDIDYEYQRLAQDPKQNIKILQRMINDAAKKAGYTIKAYHGTDTLDFTEFKKRGVSRQFTNSQRLLGFFFTPNRQYASQYGKNIMSVFLKGEFSQEPQLAINNIENRSDSNAIKWKNRRVDKGYTGSIFGDGPTQEIVVFTSHQIKLAAPVTYDDSGNIIPLSMRFNPNTKDIRY